MTRHRSLALASDQRGTQPNALRNATFATLSGHAVTKEAKGLLADVYARVVADQLEHEKTNRNPRKLRSAVDAFLADLLIAQSGDEPREWVYRAMNPRGFTGALVGYRVFLKVVASFSRLELIQHAGGVDHYTQGFSESGKGLVARRYASRFRATMRLLDLSTANQVVPADAAEHFAFSHRLPKHPLQKRTASTRTNYGKKVRGLIMKFDPTPASERLEAEVRELNEFLAKQQIEGGVHEGYLRIFQNSDNPEFQWNFGGRLYSTPPATNYQQLNKSQRLKMAINGEAVAEIDIRASYLTIFHALHGVQLDLEHDPYNLPGLGRVGRDAVKMWMVATFGSTQPLSRWPRELLRNYADENGRAFDRKKYTVKLVGEKAIGKHPLMAQWGQPLDGRVLSWADLMFLEGAVMVSAMLKLKREHEVASLAVHDSLIVPRSMVEIAEAVLCERFESLVNAKPQLVSHPQ